MAQNDAAVLVPGTGRFYTAAPGTAAPTDLLAPGVAWSQVGHTSLEDIFSTESDGGDATTLGTLQSKALRQTFSPRTESFTIVLHQFDVDSIKLYYGSNTAEIAPGSPFMGVQQAAAPTEKAFLAVFVEGSVEFAIYAAKASIFRGDDFEISDTESFAALPLRVTPLVHNTNTWAYAVTPLGA